MWQVLGGILFRSPLFSAIYLHGCVEGVKGARWVSFSSRMLCYTYANSCTGVRSTASRPPTDRSVRLFVFRRRRTGFVGSDVARVVGGSWSASNARPASEHLLYGSASCCPTPFFWTLMFWRWSETDQSTVSYGGTRPSNSDTVCEQKERPASFFLSNAGFRSI